MKRHQTKPTYLAAQSADRLLTVRDVAERLNISTRQVWKLLAAQKLPEPLRLSRSVRWRESDITRFIACGLDMPAFEVTQAAEASR